MPLDSGDAVHIAVMSRVPEQIHAVEHRSTLVGFDLFGFRGKLQATSAHKARQGPKPRTRFRRNRRRWPPRPGRRKSPSIKFVIRRSARPRWKPDRRSRRGGMARQRQPPARSNIPIDQARRRALRVTPRGPWRTTRTSRGPPSRVKARRFRDWRGSKSPISSKRGFTMRRKRPRLETRAKPTKRSDERDSRRGGGTWRRPRVRRPASAACDNDAGDHPRLGSAIRNRREWRCESSRFRGRLTARRCRVILAPNGAPDQFAVDET